MDLEIRILARGQNFHPNLNQILIKPRALSNPTETSSNLKWIMFLGSNLTPVQILFATEHVFPHQQDNVLLVCRPKNRARLTYREESKYLAYMVM